MRILVDTTLLCDPDLPSQCIGPTGLSLQGESIVDEETFFLAVAKTFFERGGESITLQFRVQRIFETHRLAERFFLTHRNNVPRQGVVQFTAGLGSDTEDIYLEDAIVQPSMVSLVGTVVIVQYVITGGQFTTDVPDPLPSADPEEDAVSFRRGSVSIGNGDSTVDVTFSAPLTGAPTTVIPTVSHDLGDDAVDCELLQDTITDSGFSVKLSAATPNANYKLHYIAFL